MKKSQTSAPVATEEQKPVSKSKKILNIVIDIVLVVAIIMAAIATYTSYVSTSGSGVANIFGMIPFSVQTESMYDTLMPGDLIISKRIKNTADLKVGDIVTYWTVIDGERVLNTHRIFAIYDGGGHRIFETKGDKNTISDPLTVHESELVGIYTGVRLAGVGKVFDFLQTSNGFLLIVVLPVALFFIYNLVQFFRTLFEYQNVKMLIKYEKERGAAEDLIEEKAKEDLKKEEETRVKIEQELREKLKAEMLAELKKNMPVQAPAPAMEANAEAVESAAENPEGAKLESVEEAPAVETPLAPAEKSEQGE